MADDPICGAIIGLFFGLVFVYSGLHRYLLAQKITNTPTSKVRSAAVGLVELSGKAVCREPITSPISQAKCVYWRVAAQYYQPGKHGGWRQLYDKWSQSDFYLEDDTGKMLVLPKGAQVEIPADYSAKGYLNPINVFGIGGKKLDAKVLEYLERSPSEKSVIQSYSHRELSFTEYYIAEGDPLYVLGTAEPVQGASSALGYENLAIGKGKIEGTFYISDSGERKVIDKIRGSMWWQLAIGAVLTVVCGFYILSRIFGG